jgi:hypothetical protein
MIRIGGRDSASRSHLATRTIGPLKTGKRHSEFRGADQNYANSMLQGFDDERRLTREQPLVLRAPGKVIEFPILRQNAEI